MLSKRFFLIAGGTVGGLGAVLAITPPQFGSTTGLTLGTGTSLSGGTTPIGGGATSTPTPTHTTITRTPTPAATSKPTKKPTKKPTPRGSTPSSTKTTPPSKPPPSTPPPSTPTPVTTPKPTGVSGTFTGDIGNTIYGPVQVQIVVVNNKITNAIALAYPTGSFRTREISKQAIPYLIQETLVAQSVSIQGVGGASYTSQGWINSLQSALTKAGL